MIDPHARVRVYLCGRLAIMRGSVVVPESAFPARQGRRLWAFGVLHRQQPIGRDELAEAVWGDTVPDSWDVALNVLVSRLRRAIQPTFAEQPSVVIGGPGRYELRLPAGTIVDYERAREALHRTDVLVQSQDWDAALAEARVAAEIAARGFLPGESGVWVEGQRRLLRSVQLHALTYTVEAELQRGRATIAEREAEQLLALDPLREGSYQLLMRALSAGGNGSGVSRVLAECQAVFAAERMTPSAETLTLAQTLAHGRPKQ